MAREGDLVLTPQLGQHSVPATVRLAVVEVRFVPVAVGLEVGCRISVDVRRQRVQDRGIAVVDSLERPTRGRHRVACRSSAEGILLPPGREVLAMITADLTGLSGGDLGLNVAEQRQEPLVLVDGICVHIQLPALDDLRAVPDLTKDPWGHGPGAGVRVQR